MEHKVLMVLYQFPPSNNVGSFRPIKFIKKLRQFGWSPIVLAPSNAYYNSYDYESIKEIEKYCNIYRPKVLLPFKDNWKLDGFINNKFDDQFWRLWNRFCLPDGAIAWLPGSVRLGTKLIESENIDLIFASGQPFSTFLIGAWLKKFTNRRFVIDYRDPWTLNPFYKGSSLRCNIENRLEKSILKTADSVCFTTNQMKSLYLSRFSDLLQNKIIDTITNSIESNYATSTEITTITKKFVITYTGNFYGNRNAFVFLKGLKIACMKDRLLADTIQCNFIGSFNQIAHSKICRDLNLKGKVNFYSRVSRSELRPMLQNSHVLLIINSYGPGHDVFIPAKFFDYLEWNKIILCMSEHGALYDAVKETDSGMVVDPKNEWEIADALLKLFKQYYLDKRKNHLNINKLKYYESEKTTKDLAELFNKTLSL